ATQFRAAAGPEYRAFSEDLSLGMVEPFGEGFTSLSPDAYPPDTERTTYLRHNDTCATTPSTCFAPLLTGAPGLADVPPGTEFGGVGHDPQANFHGASPDLTHVILGS